MEEFNDSFDDEEAEEYFTHGGRYDVTCETCNGEKVIAVVDEDRCVTEDQKAHLKNYLKYEAYQGRCRDKDARTMRMESGDYGY